MLGKNSHSKLFSNSKLLLFSSALALASASCTTIKSVSNIFNSHNTTSKNISKNASDSDLDGSLEQRLLASSRASSKFNADSVLLSNFSGYRTALLEMPSDIKIVDGDTLSFNDNQYEYDYNDDGNYGGSNNLDSVTIIHNLIVKKNALTFMPESAPYIDMIIDACTRHRGKFPVPPESGLGLLSAESFFYPYALSGARALGIAQFMRETAINFGLNVYSQKEFPKLYELETRAASLTQKYYYNKRLVTANLKLHDFDAVKKYTLIADSILENLKSNQKLFSEEIDIIGIKNIKDDRLIPAKIIPVCIEYISGLAYMAKNEYHCSEEQAVDFAMEAYNGGYGNLRNELPFVETYNHERRINKKESELFPRFSSSINTNKNDNYAPKRMHPSVNKDKSKQYWYYYNGHNIDSVRFDKFKRFR